MTLEELQFQYDELDKREKKLQEQQDVQWAKVMELDEQEEAEREVWQELVCKKVDVMEVKKEVAEKIKAAQARENRGWVPIEEVHAVPERRHLPAPKWMRSPGRTDWLLSGWNDMLHTVEHCCNLPQSAPGSRHYALARAQALVAGKGFKLFFK